MPERKKTKKPSLKVVAGPAGQGMEHRWDGITRPYSQADVERLRGSLRIEHTLADLGAPEPSPPSHPLTGRRSETQIAALK